jgi:hypothetical protein
MPRAISIPDTSAPRADARGDNYPGTEGLIQWLLCQAAVPIPALGSELAGVLGRRVALPCHS